MDTVTVMKRFRAKEELKIKILKLMSDFKSEEEPDVELSKGDQINVLSAIIERKRQ